ncbi:MAG TPA: CHAT domain-containing protein [Thermomicrobiales bacterium]|nr:CHAT domain-containing protein [Thermomicrobiales bacterium]
MMFGGYGRGREGLPRVLHIAVARYRRALPRRGEPLEFLVTIHEEGTGLSWQRNVAVDAAAERDFLATTEELYRWSLNRALTPTAAGERVRRLGRRLYDTFIGAAGERYLRAFTPTAVLLDVDETILNLPWELMATAGGPIAQHTPFGRLVTTRALPRPGRDPLQEDTTVRILVVANPTGDLAASEAEVATLRALAGRRGPFEVAVDLLAREEATRAGVAARLAGGAYDILHFAGHAALDQARPGRSALRLAEGPLTADDVLALPWPAPPYLVFNSSGESGRAAGGRRLVHAGGAAGANGLAAAFLAAGVEGYAGYFWPVTEAGASTFTGAFYDALFGLENVGLAFLRARNRAIADLGALGDLTGYSAVLFGDAASAHRRDLATAV